MLHSILLKNVSSISINVFTQIGILFSVLAHAHYLSPPLVSLSCVSQQLLAIVQQKAMVGVVDSTLKFALSALWNLTDELPTAARNFIECQGLELYEEALEVPEPPKQTNWTVPTHFSMYDDPFSLHYSPTMVNPPFSRNFLASW